MLKAAQGITSVALLQQIAWRKEGWTTVLMMMLKSALGHQYCL